MTSWFSGSRRTSLVLGLAVVTSLVVTSCSSAGSAGSAPASASATPAAPAPWDYSDPSRWAENYPDCGDTADAQQSPIDVSTSALEAADAAEAVTLAFESTHWRVFNNGHTVEAAPVTASGEPAEGSGGAFEIAGKDYEVAQFHFHAPSDHTVDGKRFALEMHVVGRSADKSTSVLGLLMEEGAVNTALQPIFDAMPTEVTKEEDGTLLASEFDLGDVLPTGAEVVRYQGSLTTPPCTENVLWNVYRRPATISAVEAAEFTSKYSNDDRPTQPLHGRRLSVHTVTAGTGG